MDPELEAELKRILAKEPFELREDEKAFLRARSSYIPKGQNYFKKFGAILKEVPVVTKPAALDTKDTETIVDPYNIDPLVTEDDEEETEEIS